MSETKRAWQEVAAILQEAGWPPPGQGDHGDLLPLSRPSKPFLYRALPVTALLILVFGAILLSVLNPPLARSDKADVARLSNELDQMQARVNSLEGTQERRDQAVRDAERLVNDAMKKAEAASASVALMKRTLAELETSQASVKADLEAASKALSGLKDDLRKEVSALNGELKREREQRTEAVESLKKLIGNKPGVGESDPDPEQQRAVEAVWRVEIVEADGMRTVRPDKDLFFELKSGAVTVRGAAFRNPRRGRYTLGKAGELKLFSVKWEKPREEEVDLPGYLKNLHQLTHGIYELKDRHLKIVLAPDRRPDELSIRGHFGAVLFTLRRP